MSNIVYAPNKNFSYQDPPQCVELLIFDIEVSQWVTVAPIESNENSRAVVLKLFEIAYHLMFFNVGVYTPGFRRT